MDIPSPDGLALISLAWIFAIWVKRIFWASGHRKSHPPVLPISDSGQLPFVSVIVPARDEEKNIGRCLESLIKQNYPSYEIIVVDDRSVDSTSEIVKSFESKTKIPVKCVRIDKCPDGWTGKNYGMVTGSKAAGGDWLLFTDADTSHTVLSLSTAVQTAIQKKIDLLTLAPETEVRTFWEKTVQPLAVSSLALWFHSEKVNDPENGVILCNGQFILISRKAYESVGGNECVKSEVIEDVELAKKIHAKGYNVQFLNGTLLYSTRMYCSLSAIMTGWTRIYTYLFNKNTFVILQKIFMSIFFSIVPFIFLSFEIYNLATGSYLFDRTLFYASAFVCGWIIAVRFIGNRLLKSDPWYAFLHPLGSVILTAILFKCLARIVLNRPSPWRGDLHQ